MSTDLIAATELAPYDDEEDLLLMDTDEKNLQLEEQSINTNTNIINQEKQNESNKNDETDRQQITQPSLLVIEKLKVYIRDGPNRHHVEVISIDNKHYELPTSDELSSINLTNEKVDEIWQSLNLTKESFRSSSSENGTSRPESLYVRGVNKMSTQDILNCFEDFQPIGVEWICDFSCNVFWHDTLNPLKVLSTMTTPGPCISSRNSVNSDSSIRMSKRKFSSLKTEDEDSVDIALPSGHWRQGDFHSFEKPEINHKFYLRYTTIDDRKVRGAENQSEYYRQYGNPNYNNMTGLISRSKKRQLNAMRSNRFRDFTVVRSNDPTSTSNSVVDETTTTTEDNTSDPNVKFTVVLPPKSSSSDKDKEDDDDDYEGGHKSKRLRSRRSWDDNNNDDDDRTHKEKTHFTVKIDSESKHRKDKSDDNSRSNHNDNDDLEPITDARQILERKRRNRK